MSNPARTKRQRDEQEHGHSNAAKRDCVDLCGAEGGDQTQTQKGLKAAPEEKSGPWTPAIFDSFLDRTYVQLRTQIPLLEIQTVLGTLASKSADLWTLLQHVEDLGGCLRMGQSGQYVVSGLCTEAFGADGAFLRRCANELAHLAGLHTTFASTIEVVVYPRSAYLDRHTDRGFASILVPSEGSYGLTVHHEPVWRKGVKGTLLKASLDTVTAITGRAVKYWIPNTKPCDHSRQPHPEGKAQAVLVYKLKIPSHDIQEESKTSVNRAADPWKLPPLHLNPSLIANLSASPPQQVPVPITLAMPFLGCSELSVLSSASKTMRTAFGDPRLVRTLASLLCLDYTKPIKTVQKLILHRKLYLNKYRDGVLVRVFFQDGRQACTNVCLRPNVPLIRQLQVLPTASAHVQRLGKDHLLLDLARKPEDYMLQVDTVLNVELVSHSRGGKGRVD